jgi:hypothetical protein
MLGDQGGRLVTGRRKPSGDNMVECGRRASVGTGTPAVLGSPAQRLAMEGTGQFGMCERIEPVYHTESGEINYDFEWSIWLL